ncbi:transmembrane protein 199 [Anastrepha ludens]|uniref:transmembrane protein 199 n=1 Tax=Anastrepha ludens TaxID=28586 RepID=UPI0023B0E1EF|nr:transmembrane protein 199 [Anastrepha ludens]
MAKSSIVDTRVRVLPTLKLLKFIDQHKDNITEMPENLSKVLKANGYNISNQIEVLKSDEAMKKQKIDLNILRDVKGNAEVSSKPASNKDTELTTSSEYLYISDLRWLKIWLTQQRKEKGLNVFLHNLLEHCSLELPENEIIERNPELEARCQRLREQQQNQEYLDMTKNVDSSLKNIPEDTIAYQVKAMNSQMIAVLQFIFSVAAGFVFGFLGLELIFGGLEFGLRLVLGICCALVIGVAEMYFLVKKLNEEEKAMSSLKKSTESVKKNGKALKSHNE